ncbi:uncharacterized protein LOC124911994 [Impatiens glandulifera]|uniref:uncharacterized protein LOC124911994 n=1 Tax=Impatiens glandulifera TaxID=253017 RepID=UPI001FB192C0|nr:uncharacterized protein LOC124911994 [Impatiens glandulifera]
MPVEEWTPLGYPQSVKVAKPHWNNHPEWTTTFLEVIYHDTLNGILTGQAPGGAGYNRVAKVLWKKYNEYFTQKMLKNRWDVLRKLWLLYQDCINSSGTSWDPKQKMIVAKDEWWQDKIGERPGAAKFRGKSLPNLALMESVFGGRTGSGLNLVNHNGGAQSHGDQNEGKGSNNGKEQQDDDQREVEGPQTLVVITQGIDNEHEVGKKSCAAASASRSGKRKIESLFGGGTREITPEFKRNKQSLQIVNINNSTFREISGWVNNNKCEANQLSQVMQSLKVDLKWSTSHPDWLTIVTMFVENHALLEGYLWLDDNPSRYAFVSRQIKRWRAANPGTFDDTPVVSGPSMSS